MTRNILSIAAGLALLTACGGGPTPEEKAKMDKEAANKAAFENIGKAWDAGDEKLLADNLADNFVTHNPDPMIPGNGKQHTIDAMKTYRGSSPDMKAEGKVLLADGDWVAGVAMIRGTNTGDMGPGMPATNKAWEATGIDVIRFENGKAVEQWALFDVMKMMGDLGMGMGGDTAHAAGADTTAKK
jgi:predicted ester cyclase